MTAPRGREIGKRLESMRDSVVELLLVRIDVGLGLGDALCDDLLKALAMAGVLAVWWAARVKRSGKRREDK